MDPIVEGMLLKQLDRERALLQMRHGELRDLFDEIEEKALAVFERRTIVGALERTLGYLEPTIRSSE